ncbi:MAG: glycosyltransferase, partial [Spirochaetia bacterium]|nr:glycosyltransferase [Spirochaetia bacterium]
KLRRDKVLVFSTGGFVALPVMIAARLLNIPAFLHEQTSRAGLANRLSAIFAERIFISFHSSRRFYPAAKTLYSGYPLRADFLTHEKTELLVGGKKVEVGGRPLIFATGGGNGSRLLNEWVARASTDPAFDHHFWIHQTGPEWTAPESLKQKPNYLSTAFVGPELPNLMKWASFVVCRGGAGTLCELRALHKPALVVPLKIAQQNEQWHNALEIQKSIPVKIVPEDEVANLSLPEMLSALEKEAHPFSQPKETQVQRAEGIIWKVILERIDS